MLQQQSRAFWLYECFIKYFFIIIVAKFTRLVTRFSLFLLWGYGFLHHKIIFSSTEIISGVIKSVKKDGEWKVTVDTKEEILLIFVALNLLPLCGLCLGSYCGSHDHKNSVLLLQDVWHFGGGGDQ